MMLWTVPRFPLEQFPNKSMFSALDSFNILHWKNVGKLPRNHEIVSSLEFENLEWMKVCHNARFLYPCTVYSLKAQNYVLSPRVPVIWLIRLNDRPRALPSDAW